MASPSATGDTPRPTTPQILINPVTPRRSPTTRRHKTELTIQVPIPDRLSPGSRSPGIANYSPTGFILSSGKREDDMECSAHISNHVVEATAIGRFAYPLKSGDLSAVGTRFIHDILECGRTAYWYGDGEPRSLHNLRAEQDLRNTDWCIHDVPIAHCTAMAQDDEGEISPDDARDILHRLSLPNWLGMQPADDQDRSRSPSSAGSHHSSTSKCRDPRRPRSAPRSLISYDDRKREQSLHLHSIGETWEDILNRRLRAEQADSSVSASTPSTAGLPPSETLSASAVPASEIEVADPHSTSLEPFLNSKQDRLCSDADNEDTVAGPAPSLSTASATTASETDNSYSKRPEPPRYYLPDSNGFQ